MPESHALRDEKVSEQRPSELRRTLNVVIENLRNLWIRFLLTLCAPREYSAFAATSLSRYYLDHFVEKCLTQSHKERVFMKSLKLRLVLMSVASVLTLGLSHRVAQATACADIIAGGNVYGDYDCRLTTFCGGWCYYNCTCS